MCKEIHLSLNYAPIPTILLAKRSWTLPFYDGEGSILSFQSHSNEMQARNLCVVVSQGKRGSNFNLISKEDVAVSLVCIPILRFRKQGFEDRARKTQTHVVWLENLGSLGSFLSWMDTNPIHQYNQPIL
jgi:hypothetical protein